ncbi:hypothetical protein GSI_05582 [Ganoderma sinense ZZ0214-1]|uniref:DUF6534 domain-containing protein n=1 Tax=Ganoderma sinense ZZ0214-1 TaxID=1077348 RepID=A0A2G8SEY9_9APHY|nr:hypothetical protein GSI_05582 [Ganoderma sinense ZZ0214-1]
MSIATDTTGLDGSYGAMLLGTFFGLVLYGLTLHQTYRYIRLHSHDYMYIQVLVALSLIFETLHAVCTMHVNYHFLVTNYFNTKPLGHHVWSLNLFILSGELSQVAAYSFFVRPSSTVAGSFTYVVFVTVVFLAADVAFSVAILIRLFQSPDPKTFVTVVLRHEYYLVHGKFIAATIAHIVLTGSLVYAVHRGQKTGKERKNIVDWCMLYVVNTGLLVSVFDVIAWILGGTMPGTIWWIGFRNVTVNLYMVTFLAVLNSRQLGGIEIFGADSTTERNVISRAQRLAAAERYNAPQLPERTPTRIDIKVATEVEGGDGESPSRTSHSSMIIEEGKVVRM